MAKVAIRLQARANGNKTITLDWFKDGKRIREALGLSIIPEATKADRDRNNETLRMANTIHK